MDNKITYSQIYSYWLMVGINDDEMFNEITERYNEPHRYYHTLSHIKAMITNSFMITMNPLEQKIIILSTFFHDLIYDPTSKTNEIDSAKRLLEFWLKHKFDQKVYDMAYFNIIASSNHRFEGSERVTKIFIDLDLSILGESPDKFKLYEEQIRKEYAFVPDEIYIEARNTVMHKLKGEYQTAEAQKIWGEKRKENLKNY